MTAVVVQETNNVVKVISRGVQGPPGPDTADLQKTTDNGNTTTNSIVLLDSLGNEIGEIGDFQGFALGLMGGQGSVLGPVGIEASLQSTITQTLATIFNGAKAGNYLQLGPPFQLPTGETIFPIQSVPLSVPLFSETFTDSNDVVLTNTFQTIVSGVLANGYEVDTGFIEFSFLLEETANQETDVEYRGSINGSPTAPFTVTITKKNGSTLFPVSSSQPLALSLSATDTVELQARAVDTGGGRVTSVKGATADTTLIFTQQPILLSEADPGFWVRNGNTRNWTLLTEAFKRQSVNSLAPSSTNADFDAAPVTKVDQNLTISAGTHKVQFSFEPSASVMNRSVVVALFIDDVLIDNEFQIQPNNTTDQPYPCKIFEHVFSGGTHNFKVKFGKRGGAGANFVTLENVRIITEETR